MASAVLRSSRVIGKSGLSASFRHIQLPFIQRNSVHRCCPNLAATQIMMPSLSPTMAEGTIVKWYKKEGDPINPGDILCDVQTDKAVVSFDTEDEGIMAKILKQENTSEIKVGTLIAIMVDEGDDWQNVEIPADEGVAVGHAETPTQTQAPLTTAQAPPTTSTASPGDMHAHGIGPAVRKLMEEYGVSMADINGSGPQNRITKADIQKVIASKNLQKQDLSANVAPVPSAAAPTPAPSQDAPTTQLIPDIEGEEFVDIPNTGMRNTIAKRLTLSKTTIPHSYVTMDCNVGPVTALRKQMVKDEIKVSVNDFIIKSAAIALQQVPEVNSVWQGEDPASMLNVDISVAVATDSGLITPIVSNTPSLAVDEISAKVKDLATRARENKLQLHEFQGGTFTISNLGMFGIGEFSAVINPPQTAIMAVGGTRLVLGEDGKPQSRMTVTLSYDARVIDESEASMFLEVFRDTIENPKLLTSGRHASKRASIL